jgi:serine/threonine protein kinase
MAARLMDPHVVTIYDVGEDQGRPFLVMELVDGTTLAQQLARRGPFSAPEARDIAVQVLDGLAAAHDQELVHRDVKPSNVLIDRAGTAKLADFGIAKALADATSALTVTGQVLGTPRYLAPEQAAGRGATAQSDLYGVGLLLYEMLAGATPFQGTSLELALAHQQAPVPPLGKQRPDVPADLVQIIERALAKDPVQRYPSAAAMRDALTAAGDATLPSSVTDTTQTAPPPSTPLPPVGAARRRRAWLIAALAAAALIALVLALTGGGSPSHHQATTTQSPNTGTNPPATQAATATSPSTTNPPTPQTIAQLAALLASNPTGYGPMGPDLLHRLEDLQTQPKDQTHKASDTIKQIQHWISMGKLDATIGQLAINVLTPLS